MPRAINRAVLYRSAVGAVEFWERRDVLDFLQSRVDVRRMENFLRELTFPVAHGPDSVRRDVQHRREHFRRVLAGLQCRLDFLHDRIGGVDALLKCFRDFIREPVLIRPDNFAVREYQAVDRDADPDGVAEIGSKAANDTAVTSSWTDSLQGRFR